MPSSDTTLHKAIVHNVSDAGVYVKIPSLLGSSESIALYKPRLTNDSWPPSVGDQLLVAVEGDNFNRVYAISNIDNQGVNYLTEIEDGAITSAKIEDGAITSAKIADGAVGASEIASGAVGASELASDAVTTVKIADGSVTNAKLGLTEVKIRRATNQTIDGFSYINFDTEDSDPNGFFPSVPGWTEDSTITVPVGYAGLYAIACRIVRSSTGAGSSTTMSLESESDIIGQQFGSSSTVGHVFANLYLPESATVRIGITIGGNVNYTARLWMTRIMD